jgi:hypothetical protein
VYRIRCFCLQYDWISTRPETDSNLIVLSLPFPNLLPTNTVQPTTTDS